MEGGRLRIGSELSTNPGAAEVVRFISKKITITKYSQILVSILASTLLASSSYARTELFSALSDQPGWFEDAFKKHGISEELAKENEAFKFGIVTHHLLAIPLLVEHFRAVAKSFSPKRIIIIGPDHFHHGAKSISLSNLPWKTPFGTLEADLAAASAIGNALGLPVYDSEAFAQEHSIGVPAAFIKHFFPLANVVPIIIHRRANIGILNRLVEVLRNVADKDTYVLLSMDFSHYKTSDAADQEDVRTESVIRSGDYRKVWDLDIDSKPGLYTLLKLTQGKEPIFGTHTNSAKLVGKLDITSCTSYFNIFYR